MTKLVIADSDMGGDRQTLLEFDGSIGETVDQLKDLFDMNGIYITPAPKVDTVFIWFNTDEIESVEDADYPFNDMIDMIWTAIKDIKGTWHVDSAEAIARGF